MNARTETQGRAHGETLIRHYAPQETDPVNLCKKLRRLENIVHSIAEGLCNGTHDETDQDYARTRATRRLAELLPGLSPDYIVINWDPRGYALKIEPGSAPLELHQDWGGFGIIAPDLTE